MAEDSEVPPRLDIHEWGTFTTFHLPKGNNLSWYTPATEGAVSELPDFVKPGLGSKFGVYTLRMETPVIYFYTDTPQQVEVDVSMQEGHITEVYPFPQKVKLLENTSRPIPMTRYQVGWRADLLPPAEAGKLSLPVDSEKPDNHYYIARDVPNAAYVAVKPNGDARPIEHEKFIFYRGASHTSVSSPVTMPSAGMVRYSADAKVGAVWLVDNRKADSFAWQKLNRPVEDGGHLDFEIAKLEQTEQQGLHESIHRAMIEEGLTADEARVMIDTWKKHWFAEPGLRAFSIVPREIVDTLVPIEISPQPSELVRVFVHRAELVSPSQMQQLEDAMSSQLSKAEARSLLKDQGMGRFLKPAITEVSRQIGNRIAREHSQRAFRALEK